MLGQCAWQAVIGQVSTIQLLEDWVSKEMVRFWEEAMIDYRGLDGDEYQVVTLQHAKYLRRAGMIPEISVWREPRFHVSNRLREKSELWEMECFKRGLLPRSTEPEVIALHDKLFKSR